MPINLTLIPQVIPNAQYLEHLDGASTSSEDTVRLFASLSLARLHPDVTTWAAAAEALNMPGPMGVRCARACSATMLVSADEWKSRIWRAGKETERRDYHLDLSPVWRGKRPTANDRAHYRQFAASLDGRQQLDLALALHKRA